ncbi:DUF6970 domain-containing protein [Hymenobacter sp. DG25A]|uniref:DUF6970 domain-containing protein n=1 Tax=Hymenobacter sp. DG25A TaxID=1385663 RepID=UPI0006BCA151|nr:hypothetical protein [Hymenobacter sp. DG25A]ALD21416.1 hypothetical protein AM218_09530 [Hymenobacter sp. DG25A]
MKKIFYCLIGSAFAFTACEKVDIAKDSPKCIKQKAVDLKEAPCESDVNIKEYFFQGKLVYVLNPGDCIADGNAEVIDGNCNSLGYLGGFGGNTKINDEDFSKAEYKRTIWEK